MAGSHSALSASGAPRWSRCVASPAACRNEPEERTNEYAAHGTAKHGVSEVCLRNGIDAMSQLGTVAEADGFKFKVDIDFVTQVQTYVDTVRRIPGTKLYEVKLDTSPVLGVPEQGGTSDTVILDFDQLTIWVIDAKFGRGMVMADSEQLRLYLEAAFVQFADLADWQHGITAVSQPSIDHYHERTWTREDSRKFGGQMAAAAHQAWLLLQESQSDATIRTFMSPSDEACKWCPIRGKCPARADKIANMFPVRPTADVRAVDRSPEWTPDSELATMLDRVDEIEAWCKDIRAEAYSRAMAGRTLPGYKLVQGRAGNRKWTDEDLAGATLRAKLGDKAYQAPKIIGIPAAEALLGKTSPEFAELALLIEKPPGAQTLVREHDARLPTNTNKVEFGVVA